MKLSAPAALLVFCALAVAWTWPVAATLSTRVPHDPGDPVLNIWILWWNAQATPFTQAWWNAPMMWPLPGTMTFSEHLVGLSLVATPLQWAGLNPIAAYNVCLILTYALSGFFGFLLGREVTGSTFAGVCVGVAFGFAPYRASQIAHIQVLSSQWMALALFGLHRYRSTSRARWLAVFGIAWLVQALSNNYFLLFFPVLIAGWLAWFVDWRGRPRQGLAVVAAWVIASLPLLPVLVKYRAVHEQLGLTRTIAEIRTFNAYPVSFLHAAPLMRFWREGPAHNYELYLFTGVTVVALAAIGVVLAAVQRRSIATPERRSAIVFYSIAFLVMCVLALGPGPAVTRHDLDSPASPWYPYTWLMALPGYMGLRVSSRFFMLATLCLAVVAGLGVARLSRLSVFARSSGHRLRLAAGAAIIGGLIVDGATLPVPVVPPPQRAILPDLSQAAVIELPLDDPDVSIHAMYRSIFHRRPLANGYSGHFPPSYRLLGLALWRGDTSVLYYLARRRPLVIIVNEQVGGRGFRTMIEEIPGIQSHGASGAGSIFVLPPQPAPRNPPPGRPVHPKVRDAGRLVMELDIGEAQLISAVGFPLGRRYEDLAPRLRVETSEDGGTWTESWLGWTGGLALEASLADPVRAPMRIPLAGVKARYLRIYPASTWMKDGIVVEGS